MKENNILKVVIDGEELNLTTDNKIEYIKKLVEFLNLKIKSFDENTTGMLKGKKNSKRYILIALNIVDEFFKNEKKYNENREELKEYNQILNDYMEENEKLLKQNREKDEKIEELLKMLGNPNFENRNF
ncbi:MAG: cell division protein ZapA [Defluviitaleaceae bacterium]|nr:cell division protein ZapA [Defluviitaleaceae bacterium]